MPENAHAPHPLRLTRYSPSDLVRYDSCPLQFYYGKQWEVRKIWERPRPALFFGTLVHNVLRDLFRGGGPHRMTWEAVRELYRERWRDLDVRSMGFESRQQAVDDYREGRHVIRWFYELYRENEPSDIKFLRVENPLQVEVEGCTLSGRLDRLDRLADGTLRIVDYKTSRQAATRKEVAGDLQLQLYALMVHREYGPTKVLVEQVQLRHGSVVQVPAPAVDVILQRFMMLVGAIEEQRFVATPHRWCGYCDFCYICPTYLTQHPVASITPEILNKVEESLKILPLWTPLLVARGLLEHQALGLDHAIASFTRAVTADPTDPTGYFLRGRVLYRDGKVRLAHHDLSKAVELGVHELDDPTPGLETTYYLGQTSAARGNWQSAVNHMTEFVDGFRMIRSGPQAGALRIDPDLVVEAQILRARAWLELEQEQRAVEALEELVYTVPDNRRALRALAQAYLEGDEPGQAEELFLRLAESGAQSSSDFLLGGQIAEDLGEWDTAVERYRHATELDLMSRQAWTALARLTYATDQHELAAEAYLNLLELEGVAFGDMEASQRGRLPPELMGCCRDLLVCQLRIHQDEDAHVTFNRLMDSLLMRGDLHEALALCNTWLAHRPGDSAVLLEKTELALEVGADGEAVDAYVQLARRFRRDGRLDQAQYMLRRALQLDAAHASAREEAASLYQARHGEVIARTGDPGQLPKAEPDDRPLFAGHAIAIIGGDKVGQEYLPKLDELGAEGTWISAATNPAHIRDKIQSMDGICVVTSEIGHALSGEAIKHAKLLGIPFIAPPRIRGAGRVVDSIAADLAPAILGADV